MSRAPWRARLVPPSIVVGTAALLVIAAATLSAAPPPPAAAAAACSSAVAAAVRAALATEAVPGARTRIVDRLGTRGQFEGRQIEVTSASGAALQISLPVESSVSQPSPNLVVYTRSASGRSEVRAIDVAAGCDYQLAQPAGIVRSALLDATGSYLYVHAVSTTRADLGVSQFAIATGRSAPILPPLETDERFGPTFGTQLSWSEDGATLVAQSCGFEACRTRLFEAAANVIEVFDDVAHGEIVGVTPTHLVAFDACSWSPCDVLAIDRVSGDKSLLAADALSAALSADPTDAGVVLVQTTAGGMEVMP